MANEIENFQSPSGVKKKIAFAAVLVASSFTVVLLSSEVLVRVFAPQTLCVPWQDEINGVMAARPNLKGRFMVPETFETVISFSSQRFRGQREYTVMPQPGVLRVAMLGDSLTYGFGANDDETYPAQLERVLANQLANSQASYKSIEIINAANGGSGTGDQALFFDLWVAQFQPHIVVLNVHANDVDDNLQRQLFVQDELGNAIPRTQASLENADGELRSVRRLTKVLPGYSFLCQRSHLLAYLRNFGSRIGARRRSVAFQEGSSKTSIQENSEEHRFSLGIPLMTAEIRWLKDRVERAGCSLVVVFLPPPWWRYPHENKGQSRSETIVQTLDKLCTAERLPFYDVTPWIRDVEKQDQRSCYYEKRDSHPNPRGYHAFAEAVAHFFRAQRIIEL